MKFNNNCMKKFIFTGYDPKWGMAVQGSVVATVYVPHYVKWDFSTCQHLARKLAGLIADGYTRKEAGELMYQNDCSVKGWRVVGARRIQ